MPRKVSLADGFSAVSQFAQRLCDFADKGVDNRGADDNSDEAYQRKQPLRPPQHRQGLFVGGKEHIGKISAVAQSREPPGHGKEVFVIESESTRTRSRAGFIAVERADQLLLQVALEKGRGYDVTAGAKNDFRVRKLLEFLGYRAPDLRAESKGADDVPVVSNADRDRDNVEQPFANEHGIHVGPSLEGAAGGNGTGRLKFKGVETGRAGAVSQAFTAIGCEETDIAAEF